MEVALTTQALYGVYSCVSGQQGSHMYVGSYNIKTDSKSLYAYVRSKSRSKDSAGPVLDSTNNLIFEPHRIASTFNDYFTSVFTQENTDTLPQVEPMLDPSDEIADIEFSEEDVDTLLTKLKDNKSPGVDNIHPTMLKNLHSELKKTIFNRPYLDYLGSDVFGKPTIIYLLLANCHFIAI